MISQKCFEKQWIEDFKRQPAYQRINPPLLEKMALLANALLHKGEVRIDKHAREEVNDLVISHVEWNYLNKLKKLPDKPSFFYWRQAVSLMEREIA